MNHEIKIKSRSLCTAGSLAASFFVFAAAVTGGQALAAEVQDTMQRCRCNRDLKPEFKPGARRSTGWPAQWCGGCLLIPRRPRPHVPKAVADLLRSSGGSRCGESRQAGADIAA